MKQIVHIKFMAVWEEPIPDCRDATSHRKAVTEFKLGAGPCGLSVSRLDIQLNPDSVHIGQECSDGTFTEFVYKKSDIIGRIEVTAIETERQGVSN